MMSLELRDLSVIDDWSTGLSERNVRDWSVYFTSAFVMVVGFVSC